jgi:branched-chain amino acid transport system substrate-binding protein
MSHPNHTFPQFSTRSTSRSALFGARGRVVLAACALGCAALPAACSSQDTSATLNVGLLLPFTGEVGAMGINLEEAAMMVADEVNAHGGLAGKRLRLVVGDTHSESVRALESLNRILDEGVVAVIGPESADVAMAILPVLKQRRLLFVSPHGTDSVESTDADADYPWFRLAATPTSFGQALAKRMIADGESTASIVYTSDLYNSALAAAAAAEIQQLGGSALAQIALPVGHEDYSNLLMRASAANLQTVLLAADPISGARIVNDLSILYPSPNRRWYFSPTLKTSSFVANAFPEKIEGAVGVAPSIFASTDAFEADFTATWNGDVPLDGAFYYYDALTVVALSIEHAWIGAGKQDPTFEALRDAVRAVAHTFGIVTEWNQIPSALDLIRKGDTTYYTGLSGPILLDNKGVRQMGTAALWKVVGGKIVNLN